jgi:hypothetical protein
MGRFTDRIKKMFSKSDPDRGKPSGFTAEQEILIRQHGGKRNLKTFDDLHAVLYAIRLTDNPNYFIHPIGETKDQMLYVVKKGIIGAAFWKWQQGMEFINQGKETNVEMVRIDRKFLDEQNAKSK